MFGAGFLMGTNSLGDIYRQNRRLILHCAGENNSTVLLDTSPNPSTFSLLTNASISTARFAFGNSSLLLTGTPISGSASTANHKSVLGNIFTIEGWMYPTSIGGDYRTVLASFDNASGSQWILWITPQGKLELTVWSWPTITSLSNCLLNTWQHWAV